MCTSLIYRDASDRPYLGRTLELSMNLPYQVSFMPRQITMTSKVDTQPALTWTTNHAFIAVTMPEVVPQAGSAIDASILKVVEGVNDAGLTFSVQAYAQAGGPQAALDGDQPALSAADLGVVLAALLRGGEGAKAVLDAGAVSPGAAAGAVAEAFRLGLAS